MPVLVTRCSSSFGTYQYPCNLIPLFVTNALENNKLPIYGDGKNIRDWIYIEDHCRAIDVVLRKGSNGEVYNIGAGNEKNNLEITRFILDKLGKPDKLMTYVPDRLGHDRRYSLDWDKIKRLGWQPQHSFADAMTRTIDWYQNNRWWWEEIKSGEYLEYYKNHYTIEE